MSIRAEISADIASIPLVRPLPVTEQPTHRTSAIVRFAGFAFTVALCLTLFLLSEVTAAGFQYSAKPLEPPNNLLPGLAPMPGGDCESLRDGRFRCALRADGGDINVLYDGTVGAIRSTTLAESDHTLGDLIVAWGTPSGLIDHGNTIEVRWKSRGAYLSPCTFRADSRVFIVVYGEPGDLPSAWHGFSTVRDLCASNPI